MDDLDLDSHLISATDEINRIVNSLLDHNIINDERLRDPDANALVFSDHQNKLAMAIGFDGGAEADDKEEFINFVKRFEFNLDSRILGDFIRIPCEQIGIQFVFDENGIVDLSQPNSLYFVNLAEKWLAVPDNHDPRPNFPEDRTHLNNFEDFVADYNKTIDDLEHSFVGFYCDANFENYISYKHYYGFKKETYLPHTMIVDYKSTGVSTNYDIMEDFYESIWWNDDHMNIISTLENSGIDLSDIGVQASAKMGTQEPQNYLHIYG